jgi:CO/xanthine dehydrogenase Mo-binding subunit
MKAHGTGIAAVNYPTGMNLGGDPSQAYIFCQPGGSFRVQLGSIDLGQGLKTAMTQIAAETLGVTMDDIYLETGDTDGGPHCMGTFASRGTHRVGNAVIMAANEVKESLLAVAADELEAATEDLVMQDGVISVVGSPDRTLSLLDVASAAHFKYGKMLSGRGIYLKQKSSVDPETGACDPDSTEAHATTVAEVEVDTETGEVTVLRLSGAYEVGRQINPAMVEGQIVSGAVMGMSHALMETEFPYWPSLDHHIGTFSEYVIPTTMDLPDIRTKVLEYPSANGPYGVKGVGEMTANSPIPAIINAIHDAVGIWCNDLPATPEKVLRLIEQKDQARDNAPAAS